MIVVNPLRRRQIKLMKERASYDMASFVSHFSQLGIPESVPKIVWSLTESYLFVENFVPSPSDRIAYDYGIIDEDAYELVFEAIAKCNKVVPSQEERESMDPVVTMEDLISYIHGCKDR